MPCEMGTLGFVSYVSQAGETLLQIVFPCAIMKLVMYMHFYEKLNELIAARGIRSQEICDAAGIKKAYLSKLRKGTLFPPNWSTVHDIAQFLNLRDDEYHQLCDAYKAECLPQEILAEEDALISFCNSDFQISEPKPVSSAPSLSSGAAVRKDAVIPAVRQMLTGTAVLRVLGLTTDAEIRTELLRTLASNAESEFQLLLLIDDNEVSPDSLKNCAEVMPLLYHAGGEIRIAYIQLNAYLTGTPFPLMLAADSRVLLLNAEGTEGLFLENESAEPYLRFFSRKYEDAAGKMVLYRRPEVFLADWQRLLAPSKEKGGSMLYGIVKAPSLVFEASQQDIIEHISADFSAEQIAEPFNKVLQNLVFSTDMIMGLFWREGVSDILHASEYYEYGKFLSSNLDIKRRRELFRKTIENGKMNQDMGFGMILSPYRKTQVFGLNVLSDGRMLAFFDNENGFCIASICDKKVTDSILAWISSLQKCGIIVGKEEAIRYCETALQRDESLQSRGLEA